MLNKISIYSAVIGLAVITLVLIAIIYKADWHLAPVSVADKIQVTAITSEANAGGRIAMKHSVVGDLQIHNAIMLELDFTLSAGQLLTLDFVDSEQYQFNDDPAAVYSADERGRLILQLNLSPLTAGKIYIKFLASTTDGERMRSFSIPLQVKNSNGLLLKIDTVSKPRINLPVKDFY